MRVSLCMYLYVKWINLCYVPFQVSSSLKLSRGMMIMRIHPPQVSQSSSFTPDLRFERIATPHLGVLATAFQVGGNLNKANSGYLRPPPRNRSNYSHVQKQEVMEQSRVEGRITTSSPWKRVNSSKKESVGVFFKGSGPPFVPSIHPSLAHPVDLAARQGDGWWHGDETHGYRCCLKGPLCNNYPHTCLRSMAERGKKYPPLFDFIPGGVRKIFLFDF